MTKTPMYFIAIACIINIGLDYLFMELSDGVSGAALGTVLSQACTRVLISLIIILKRKMTWL